MKSFLLLSFTLFTINIMLAQNKSTELPYTEIPAHSDEYTAEAVVARMVDGLGFRYRWATEGLRPEDLEYKPSPEARSCRETLDHIYDLSECVIYPVKKESIKRGTERPEMSFDELRKATLENLKTAADILRSGEVKLADCPLIFERPDRQSEYPFWNNLNGPIADAIWHCGQVVSFRRASGNPFNSKVSVFQGKVRE